MWRAGGPLGQAPTRASLIGLPALLPLHVSTGPGRPADDGRVGSSHHGGLVQGEPFGCPVALPVPGLAGLCVCTQLLRLAGQLWPAWWPKACGMRSPALRGLWLLPGRPCWWWWPSRFGGHQTREFVWVPAQEVATSFRAAPV